jgi:DNA-binding transcriptional LysR family regulator
LERLVFNDKNKLTIINAISVNSVNGQKQLLLNHTGLALMPLWAVQIELENGPLVKVMPDQVFGPYEKISAMYAIYL